MNNKFIYKVSSFETKRHKKSHTNMYFAHAEHTEWVFNSCDYLNGLAKVEYIMVAADSKYYEMAVECSNIQFWADKQKQLMKEFERYGMKECVVCYEVTKWYDGTRCKTCKNAMCHMCCCEYMNANEGKFPFQSDETGYCVEVLLPCPMCRTDNLFCF